MDDEGLGYADDGDDDWGAHGETDGGDKTAASKDGAGGTEPGRKGEMTFQRAQQCVQTPHA